MTRLIEERLTFDFLGDLSALHYDKTTLHTKQFGHYSAVDFLVVIGSKHWWLEIKDCKQYEEVNRPRLSPQDPYELVQTRDWITRKNWKSHVSAVRKKPFIVDEVIQKLRDTMVGLSVAKRLAISDFTPYADWSDSSATLRFILFLTWDAAEFKLVAKRLQHKLNQALKPYGVEGFVVDESTLSLIVPCTVCRNE